MTRALEDILRGDKWGKLAVPEKGFSGGYCLLKRGE